MPMRAKFWFGTVVIAVLAACSGRGADAPQAAKALSAAPAPRPGSDRDAHGCIPSAGYAWCASTNRCERPWELAKDKGFDNAPDAFDKFCANPAK